MKQSLRDDAFEVLVRDELARARAKFPDSVLSLAALTEEVGELARAYLNFRYGKGTFQDVLDEAKQVAAMAQRVATEGDITIVNQDIGRLWAAVKP